MPADTPTIGYPAHAVNTYSWDVNEWGTRWVHWTAQCGATGHGVGGHFLPAGKCRRLELCPKCFPGYDRNACWLKKPEEIPSHRLGPNQPE